MQTSPPVQPRVALRGSSTTMPPRTRSHGAGARPACPASGGPMVVARVAATHIGISSAQSLNWSATLALRQSPYVSPVFSCKRSGCKMYRCPSFLTIPP